MLSVSEVNAQRQARVGLGHDWADPVAELGAVQGQEFAYALWALAQRMGYAVTAAELGERFDSGRILRTHVLRPTWHLVTPETIGDLMTVTADRVKRVLGTQDRVLGITAEDIAVSGEIIADAVADEHRTRAEIGAHLGAAGLPDSGPPLAQLMAHAELDRRVISGARRGVTQTYASWSSRVPAGERDYRQALLIVVERFLRTRGPVSVKDFTTWSGSTVADTKWAIAELAPESAEVDGAMLHWLGDAELGTPSGALLLGGYDEYVMSYFETKTFLFADRVVPAWAARNPVVADGLVVGSWKHTIAPKRVTLDVRCPAGVDISGQVAHYERFWGRPVTVSQS